MGDMGSRCQTDQPTNRPTIENGRELGLGSGAPLSVSDFCRLVGCRSDDGRFVVWSAVDPMMGSAVDPMGGAGTRRPEGGGSARWERPPKRRNGDRLQGA